MANALSFVGASTNYVNCGKPENTMPQGTVCLWAMPTSVANAFNGLAGKDNATATGGWRFFQRAADGTSAAMFARRATTSQSVATPTGTLVVNRPVCLAGTWDVPNGGPKMFAGTLWAPMTDVTTSAADGSGTQTDDSANDVALGSYTTGGAAAAWPGFVWWVGLYNVVLTLAEVRLWQFDPLAIKRGRLGVWGLGQQGTSRVLDLSGNGFHGTISGAAQSGRPLAIPAPPLPNGSPAPWAVLA